LNAKRTWHRIKLNTLQRRLTGRRPWRWETRMDRGRKRMGLVGAGGRFYWFRLGPSGAFVKSNNHE